MSPNINSSTFKNSNNGKKKNPIVPLIIIIVLALALVLLQYFLIDFTGSLYEQQPTETQQQVE